MNALVRRSAALCALGALTTVLVGCSGDARPVPAERPPAASRSAPPTLAPGPQGLTPVFENGPRTHGRTVALTFDADMTAGQGPRAAAGERFDNPALVATLRRLKVPATFFMTGRWADEYPSQAADIGRDPLFEVANHSYSHYAFTGDCYGLPTVPPARMRADMERAFAAFRTAGVERSVPYFRFPGGCYDQRALRALAPGGVTAVQWDVVGGDAFATDPAAVARQVLDGVRPGSVVVLHCTRSAAPATERALRTIVPELRKRGYRFVRVSEQIGSAGARR
ncbi:polysaccharide deacetylase [Streptomyces alfalfae]|uniref:Polysaccharide deacetylase n=1 Tax=Streptomyces alfalfae TaxID=1642299 RepID=A0ABM6GPC2_9ACTN|nr:polysaccharide deacetylase family protein [Streptomyces alfalfae]AYA16154.1 polysaccharide deacetylase [Streptomyces fradiae]APY85793.1 polysaccharide deacetylase [Streptomyces alfalfae]QUI34473.1 polysaccharide deacetylase family protein [Streptomyces alfalfae]RXX39626.1 polysaccharide deacetylase [Streptomyces alfalfae]RZM84249.1 polysaccharide deacetylase [Streptomyces alfalfae]